MAEKKKTAPKVEKVKVARDRILIGARVKVRDTVLTVGKDISADVAKKYKTNGWVENA